MPTSKAVPRVLFYVQYLLGIGHVRRSALVVQALAKSGIDVDVVFGGVAVPHISFAPATLRYLEAVKSADNGFSDLIKADGSEFTENDKVNRASSLIQLCEQLQPDLIVTETYPFGRRQMRFELIPLLNWAKQQASPPLLISSIRDILQARKAKREDETIQLIQDYYDHVLIHGDPDFTPLQNSFAKAKKIQEKLSYSGYVCPEKPAKQTREKLIVVSIGGGAVGKEVLETSLELCRQGSYPEHQWLLITGPNMPDDDKQNLRLSAQNTMNLQVVELAEDFICSLSKAELSISMAGYNTVMDLLQTETPAVVIPFEADSETEQLSRSLMLEDKGLLTIVREKQLNTESLKYAMEHALQQSHARPFIDINGAEHSANLLRQWATEHLRSKA